MTPYEFAEYVRFKTRTNSTTFTDAMIKPVMKVIQREISKAIILADEDILLIPQYTSLVADQREYPFPADMLSRIKRVEAKLDGSNFIKLKELDVTEDDEPIFTESEITNRYSNLEGEAFFDIKRRAIYVFSGTITSVTNGLKILVNTWPTAITDLSEATADMSTDPSTTTHGIPTELHKVWATGVIIEYKGSREKPIPLTEQELRYEFDLNKSIEVLKHGNLDREKLGRLPDAGDRGNDGADY